jgi:hypothetical protein
MTPSFHSTLTLIAAAAFATLAHTAPAPLDAAGSAQLEAFQQHPETAGAVIYRGSVVPLGATTPLYRYERRVTTTPEGLAAAHITRELGGHVLIAEQARFTPDYALRRFDASNRQLGYSGSVLVSADGRHLEYRLSRNGKLSTASEAVSDPVVSGPSLHGFIVQHWDALAAGQRVPVRMIVLTEKQTYGFVIRRSAHDAQHTAFTLTPSSALVRMLVAPLTVSFDTTSRNVIRYEGRVPPLQPVAGKLQPLDARVDYTMAVAAYR